MNECLFPHNSFVHNMYSSRYFTFLVDMETVELKYLVNPVPIPDNTCYTIMTMLSDILSI